MHELYRLEQTALEGYASHNFPKVMIALTNFANITLSSLYFDITKDCLYANDIYSVERRAVITVFEHILRTITPIMAPVLPHLAEEIHDHWKSDGKSVFMSQWTPLSSEWNDAEAARTMLEHLRLRSTVLSLLEKARTQKLLRSSLEAEVDLVIPTLENHLDLKGQEHLLKTLFIVSDVKIGKALSPRDMTPSWSFLEEMSNYQGSELLVRVRPATGEKCPRCWTYTRLADEAVCHRCSDILSKL